MEFLSAGTDSEPVAAEGIVDPGIAGGRDSPVSVFDSEVPVLGDQYTSAKATAAAQPVADYPGISNHRSLAPSDRISVP